MSPKKTSSKSAETSQFALRLKPELYEQLKHVAGEASISVNQLVQGICEAAMDNVEIGEPVTAEGGYTQVRRQDGCVCFGDFGDDLYSYKGGKPMGEFDLHAKHKVNPSKGNLATHPDIEWLGTRSTVWFGLDYSNRGYRKY